MSITHPDGVRDSLVRAALAMAARGWHVFPCVADGKRPALRGSWQQHATTDADRIRHWWASAPYNIGISCGPSGLVIIDLDVAKDGSGPHGADSLARLCARHGQPRPSGTLTVRTPSGGTHLYFRAAARPVRNSAGRLGPRIDIRADGGYVVGPGSRIGERVYEVRGDALPQPVPEWIIDALTAPAVPPVEARSLPDPGTRGATAYAMAALREETLRMAIAVDGTRHDTLNKAAFSLGQLVAAGLLPDLAVITSLADAARMSGLPEHDIVRIIRAGMAAGARHPRPPRPLPAAGR
jgi:Bifunctional DNA primase/polymerase, N-terminal